MSWAEVVSYFTFPSLKGFNLAIDFIRKILGGNSCITFPSLKGFNLAIDDEPEKPDCDS